MTLAIDHDRYKAGGARPVAESAFVGIERRTRIADRFNRGKFNGVVGLGSRGVSVDEVNWSVVDDGFEKTTQRAAGWIAVSEMSAIAAESEMFDPHERVMSIAPFQANRRRGFAHQKSGPAFIERPAADFRRRKHAETFETVHK